MLSSLHRPTSLLCRISRIAFVRHNASRSTRPWESTRNNSHNGTVPLDRVNHNLHDILGHQNRIKSDIQARRPITTGSQSKAKIKRTPLRRLRNSFPVESAVGGVFNLNERMDKELRESRTYNLAEFLHSTADVRRTGLKARLEREIAGQNLQDAEAVEASEKWVALLNPQDPQSFIQTWMKIPLPLLATVGTRAIFILLDHPGTLVRLLVRILLPRRTAGLATEPPQNILPPWLIPQIMHYLYHHSLYEHLDSSTMCVEFYRCLIGLLTRGDSAWRTRLVLQMPNYFLHQKCPSMLKKRLLRACSVADGQLHWESQLLACQEASANGAIKKALLLLLDAIRRAHYVVPYTVEFHNAMTTMLEYARKTTSDLGPEELVMQLLKSMWGSMNIHDATFRKLISYSAEAGSDRALLEISRILQAYGDHHPAIQVELVVAMTKIGMDPIEIQRVTPQQVLFLPEQCRVYNNNFFKTSLFLLAKKNAISEGRWMSFRESLPYFQQFFRTDFLQQLGMPCSPNHAEDISHPTNIAVAFMITSYFQEHQYNPEVVYSIYQKFMQSLDYNSEIVRIATWNDARVHNAILKGLVRSKDRRFLEDCLNILADLLQNHNPAENFPRTFPEAMRKSEVWAGPSQVTWLWILRAFIQFDQLQAAERILAEVWKKVPLMYDMCCDEMIGAYLAKSEKEKAMYLLQRKLNAGWEMTDFTLKKIAQHGEEWPSQQFDSMQLDTQQDHIKPSAASAAELLEDDILDENTFVKDGLASR